MVVDKAGRTVIPKPLRDRLRLEPGAELEARVEDGELVAKPVGPQLVLARDADGRPVLRTTEPVPLSNDDVVQLIHDLREERMQYLLQLNTKPDNGRGATDR